MNLRTQLEGNSFAELIQRNTDDTNSLKADAFATADCRFQLANLDGTAAGYALHGFLVADDPSTPDCDETLLLMRMPDGTIAYRQRNTVDPSAASTASRSTRARPASTASSAATTTTPSGVRPATTASKATAATTSLSVAMATTSSPTSTAPTCSRAAPATTPWTPAPATTS